MKRNQILFIASIFCICLVISSCVNEKGTVEITYQEATAIYGDLDAIRATPLNATARTIENAGKIYIADNFILVGEEEVGIHVIDNTNRANPSNSSFINIPGNKEFFVDGNTLYAESNYDMLKIDITNPNQVALLSRAENAVQSTFLNDNEEALLGFNFTEKTVLLDEDDDFYQEVRASNYVYFDYANNVIPHSAIPTSFAGNSAAQSGTVNRINKSGDYIYLISNSNIIVMNDNSFADNFRRNDSPIVDMETVFPYEDHLFIGSRSSMGVFDLNDPMNPRESFTFDHATSCDPVLPHNEVAYITLRNSANDLACQGDINSLIVVDIDDITQPEEIENIDMTSPYGMTVIGNHLFIGEGTNGLKIFDITNNKQPQLVKEIANIEAYDIISDPQNSNIIFIAGPEGLNQFIIDADLNLNLESTIEI